MEQAQNNSARLMSKAVEAFGACVDTNLRIFRQLTDFSANVAKESISLSAELQTATLEAIQEEHAYLSRQLSQLPEALQNPLAYQQQGLHDLVDSAKKVLKLLQNNTQAIMRSSEQYGLTTRQTNHSIQTTCTQLADKLKSLYTSA